MNRFEKKFEEMLNVVHAKIALRESVSYAEMKELAELTERQASNHWESSNCYRDEDYSTDDVDTPDSDWESSAC